MCQIQYNFMDVCYQAGREGLSYAASRGLAVVVMEPLRGGQLAQPLTPAVEEVWSRSAVRASAVDRALQWLWDQPNVGTVLSGMSSLEHVRQNLASAAGSRPHSLSDVERALYLEAKAAYDGLKPIPCTQCKYCLPCFNGVDVFRNLQLYNEATLHTSWAHVHRLFRRTARGQVPLAAVRGRCPQQIPQLAYKVGALLGPPTRSDPRRSLSPDRCDAPATYVESPKGRSGWTSARPRQNPEARQSVLGISHGGHRNDE
jgi:predicted aldo/keto reductase-like oxidoreductase